MPSTDISACPGGWCRSKETCWRYMLPAISSQSMMDFTIGIEGDRCPDYWKYEISGSDTPSIDNFACAKEHETSKRNMKQNVEDGIDAAKKVLDRRSREQRSGSGLDGESHE